MELRRTNFNLVIGQIGGGKTGIKLYLGDRVREGGRWRVMDKREGDRAEDI